MASGIYNQPVVFDNGSGVLKAGFAGEDRPKAVFSSFVGAWGGRFLSFLSSNRVFFLHQGGRSMSR